MGGPFGENRKNSISHRGRAMRKLIEHLKEMQM